MIARIRYLARKACKAEQNARTSVTDDPLNDGLIVTFHLDGESDIRYLFRYHEFDGEDGEIIQFLRDWISCIREGRSLLQDGLDS